MPIEETIVPNALRAAFGDLPVSEFRGDTRVVVPAEKIYEVLELLKEKHGFDLLVDITCVDYLNYPGAKDRFGLVYLLAGTVTNQRLTIRAFVNEPEPAVRSVVGLWEGANWLEREVWDMFGIRFEGHPDLRRILMPEEFTAFPLRKDYPLQGLGERHNFPVLTRGKVETNDKIEIRIRIRNEWKTNAERSKRLDIAISLLNSFAFRIRIRICFFPLPAPRSHALDAFRTCRRPGPGRRAAVPVDDEFRAAAPGHAYHAAPGAEARRRARGGRHSRHRLSPLGLREARREPRFQSVRDGHRPHELYLAHVQQRRLAHGGREAAGHRSHAAVQLYPHDRLRTDAAQRSPALPGRDGPGHRRHHALHVRLQRAGDDLRHLRGPLRRPLHE